MNLSLLRVRTASAPGLVLVPVALLALTSCLVAERRTVVDDPPPSSEIIVQEAPPAPQGEVVTVEPSPSHAWVGGYWQRRDRAWIWIHGAWVVRPHATAIWVSGRWEARGSSWCWVPGHWRG